MIKRSLLILVTLLSAACTRPSPEEHLQSFDGLVINELYPARTITKTSWLEICNTTNHSIRLDGLRIALVADDSFESEVIAVLSAGTVEPGGHHAVYSDESSFSKPVLKSTVKEILLLDGAGTVIDSFSPKYDCSSTEELQDGYSYSRIPDISGKWTVSNVATPGERNYKITPYTLTSIVINEVCPEEGWIEIVNNAGSTQNLEYASLVSSTGEKIYTFPEALSLGKGERTVVECEASLNAFTLCSNTGKMVVEFSSEGLAAPVKGGSWSRLPDVTGSFKAVTTATRNAVNADVKKSPDGIVINEVCVKDGWVEISNSNIEITEAPELRLYLAGKSEILAASIEAVTYTPGSKVVKRVNLGGSTGLILRTVAGECVDRIDFSDVTGSLPSDVRSSWSRIPDGTGHFYAVRTPSEGEKNYGIQQDNNIALWVPQSATNAINLEELCKLGYGQIFLHEYAFKNYGTEKVMSLIRQAESLGQKIHIWMQCFWWNETGWKSPVIDRSGTTPASYDQAMFSEIINRARPYVNAGAHGIHFDYVRFAGTASKHNFPEDGVTSIGAITEFCRQANVTLKGLNPNLMLSAAVMGEKAPQNSYGQDIAQMSNYLDAFLPMAYISSYNYGPTTNASVAQWFKDKAGSRKVWHGFSTYDSNSKGLSAEHIYEDCKNVETRSTVDGAALFRYGIGTLPDMNDLFKR